MKNDTSEFSLIRSSEKEWSYYRLKSIPSVSCSVSVQHECKFKFPCMVCTQHSTAWPEYLQQAILSVCAFFQGAGNEANRWHIALQNWLEWSGLKITSSSTQKKVSSSFETKLHSDSLLHACFAFSTLTREANWAWIIERSIMLPLCY